MLILGLLFVFTACGSDKSYSGNNENSTDSNNGSDSSSAGDSADSDNGSDSSSAGDSADSDNDSDSSSAGDSDNSSLDTDIPKFVTVQTVASMKETVVKVAGKNSALLTVIIPKLPFGMAQDIEIEFELVYKNKALLPQIQINTALQFDKAVILKFRSDELAKTEYSFVFYGKDLDGNKKDYLVPSTLKDNLLTVKLLHFSKYGFDKQPAQDQLNVIIQCTS